MIRQPKIIQISNTLLADLLIHQIFVHQMLQKSQFTKLSLRHIFLLYSILEL